MTQKLFRQLNVYAKRSAQEAYSANSLSGFCSRTAWVWALCFAVGLASWYAVVWVGRSYGYGPLIALVWLGALILLVSAQILPSAYGADEESDDSAARFVMMRAIPNALATGMTISFFSSLLQHLLRLWFMSPGG